MKPAPVRFTLTLSATILTVGTAFAAPPSPTSTGPDWLSGMIGMVILAIAAYFGIRYARLHGLNARRALRDIGVELPQDAVTTPEKPAPPPPPLPSLSELAAPAPAGAAEPVSADGPAQDAGSARLVGLTAAVSYRYFSLEAGAVTIGRDGASTIPLTGDSAVSRRHAHIEPRMGGDLVLIDDGSQNGTYVNDVRTQERILQPGDEIQIGSQRFRFER